MNKEYISILDLKSSNISLFLEIKKLLKSPHFPCLFAINSFHKNHLHVYDIRNSKNKSLDTYNQLNKFHDEYNSILEKNFYTILIVVPNIKPNRHNIKKFIFNFLISLKQHETPPTKLTYDEILEQNFEFSLNGNIWFPVFLCQNHISKIRNSNLNIIAFQPKRTFNILKSCPHGFYEKTRSATHKRIDLIYNFKRPFFLSNKSRGANSTQYLGFDPINESELP